MADKASGVPVVSANGSGAADAGKRSCVHCGAYFARLGRAKVRKFCGDKCRIDANNAKLEKRPGIGRPKGVVGAFSELLASADLLKRGYDVFRAVSPACPCDLVAMKCGKLIRIEVRTGIRGKNGQLQYPNNPAKANLYDVMAIVLVDGAIEYRPPLESVTPDHQVFR